jgi:hypothetical protein
LTSIMTANGRRSARQAKSGFSRRQLALTLVVLGAAAYLVLPLLPGARSSVALLRGLRWWAVALAVAAQFASFWWRGFLLGAVVSTTGTRIPHLRAMVINLAAASIGLVGGGFVGFAAATYRWSRAGGAPAEGALLAGWLPSLLFGSTVFGVAMVGLIDVFTSDGFTFNYLLAALSSAALIAASVATTLWVIGRRERCARIATWGATRWARLRRFAPDRQAATQEAADEAAARLSDAWDTLHRGAWHAPVLGALCSVLFDILSVFFLFLATGRLIGPGALFAGYGLPHLFGNVSLIPGGIGVVEGTMVAFFHGRGIPTPAAAVVVLTYRALNFWIPLVVGLPLAAWLERTQALFSRGLEAEVK